MFFHCFGDWLATLSLSPLSVNLGFKLWVLGSGFWGAKTQNLKPGTQNLLFVPDGLHRIQTRRLPRRVKRSYEADGHGCGNNAQHIRGLHQHRQGGDVINVPGQLNELILLQNGAESQTQAQAGYGPQAPDDQMPVAREGMAAFLEKREPVWPE